jgi:hypothetical protein
MSGFGAPTGRSVTAGTKETGKQSRNTGAGTFVRAREDEGPIRQTRGGGEWEPIKILLEGDGDSNKTNTASNTRLRLTTQVGQAHVAAGVPLNLGTNKQPSEPKTHQHTQRKLAQLAACAAPVRPMAYAGQIGDTGQTGRQSRSGRWLQ